MSTEKLNIPDEDKDISYSGIFKKVKSSWKFLKRKWWILLIALVLGGGAGFLISKIYGIKYSTNCVYTVQGQSASSSMLSSALSLASSLGITSAKPGTGSYDNNFFANLMESRRIVKQAFLDEAVIDGKKDLLINHFTRIEGFSEKWEDDNRLKNFKFKHSNIKELTRLEDSVLSYLYNKILDDYLTVSYDDNSPFNHAKFESVNRELARQVMKHLLDKTSAYYMQDMFALNNNNFKLAEKRVDSIANAIRDLDSKVARLKDNANNVIKQSGLVDLNSAIRDQSLLSIQYSSAINNYELAKVTLMANAPILEVIDDPLFSTDVLNIPIILATIVGGFIFFFLTLFVLIFINFVKGTVKKEKENKNQETITP